MPKDNHAISIGDPYEEIKKAYVYRDRHVCKRRFDISPSTVFYMARQTNPKGEYFWNLKGRRINESWAKDNLQETPRQSDKEWHEEKVHFEKHHADKLIRITGSCINCRNKLTGGKAVTHKDEHTEEIQEGDWICLECFESGC